MIRRVLLEGEQLTLEVEQEHREVNEIVSRLEELELTHAERTRLLDRLMLVLRTDVRDEEDELLPQLQRRGPLHTVARRRTATRSGLSRV